MNKRVALFANGWNGENLDFFINGFNEYFTDGDVDLFVFNSHMLTAQHQELRDSEDSIYDLPDYSFFDAAVVYGSGRNTADVLTRFVEKCKAADVPVILQGMDVEGISSVTIDNYAGMKSLCDHIIEEHGVSDVVYIAGDRDNGDSNFRLQVLREALETHGHELKEDNIFYACWDARTIQSFLTENYGNGKKKLPDAFVCANDQMALSALSFLDQMGVKLPEEVIVTGFDNLSPGRAFCPSLATVDQRYEEQGFECAKYVAEAVNNKKLIRKGVVPTVLSPGESCGCGNCKGENELRKIIARDNWSSRFRAETLQGRMNHLDGCIVTNERFENIHRCMNGDFFKTTGLETEDFHIYVNPQYKELKYKNVSEGEFDLPYYSPTMEVVAARTGGVVYEEDTVDPKTLFLGYDGTGKGRTYVFTPLIIGLHVFGYMVMGHRPDYFDSRMYVKFANGLRNSFEQYQRNIEDYFRAIHIKEQASEFLQQTVEALASAVDAKDSYTHGHSARVAKYARQIAERAGLSEDECDDIYLAGLLHDVGKIGIDDQIINKAGRLTNEEFAIIKQHPVLGDEILAKIHMSPYLSIGARHHHERYDGKGYPDNLKGEEIPQIARIIAVADAYDAMTSKRSYRDVIPQMQVREELVKGIGTQFDPEYAKLMIQLLDLDVEYQMKENRSEDIFEVNASYKFDTFKNNVSAGLRITDCPVTIQLQYNPLMEGGIPTLLFYDSTDARFYLEESPKAKEMVFTEFAKVRLDGKVTNDNLKKIQQNISDEKLDHTAIGKRQNASLYIVKQEDHLLVKLTTESRTDEIIFALHDASRFMYLALTGENCSLEIQDINVAEEPVQEGYIPRIAEKASYIDGPAGDIPNVQIDAWKSATSEVLEITEGVSINFHTMSLPSAWLVWHCPIVCLFTADDGKIDGQNYREVAMIRLDGEIWGGEDFATHTSLVTKDENFENWNVWKDKNKAGQDCTLSIQLEGDTILTQVEDAGLTIINQTKMDSKVEKIYFFFTGDQCAITNICVAAE